MDFNFNSEAILYLAQFNPAQCRNLFFELNYWSLREAVLHGVLLLITGLIYRL